MKAVNSAASKGKKNKRADKVKTKRKILPDSVNVSLYIAAVALVLAVVICYANSLGNGFVFDDHFLVQVYGRPRSLAHTWKMLIDGYRPMRNLSYILDFIVWGENPFGFHLTNLLIHAANTLLLFSLVKRLTAAISVAFVAALIFAVHPIQTDAVAYISGRRDILFTLFYLASFYSYLRYRQSGSRWLFAAFLVLWAFSLMSKEMAISLPIVIFVWNFCDSWGEQTSTFLNNCFRAARRAFARDRWLYIALIVIAAAFTYNTIFRLSASGRAVGGQMHYWGGSFFTNLLIVLRVHAWYLKQLVWPTPIAQYFGAFDVSTSLADLRVWGSLIVVGGVLATGFLMLKKDKLISFAILSYFAMLIPVSQLIPHHELVADHYLYLPMMSFGLLAGLLFKKLAASDRQTRQIAYASVAVVALIFSVLTIGRNNDWKDDFSVWNANYQSVPQSPRASYNLAGFYFEKKDFKRAEELLTASIKSDPGFEPAYLSLAKLYIATKRNAEAKELIQTGLSLPEDPARSFIFRNTALLRSQFLSTMAGAEFAEGNPQAMEQLLRQAIDTYPLNPEPYKSLSNYYHRNNAEAERDVLKQGIAIIGNSFELRARLVSLMIENGNIEEAKPLIQQMQSLSPSPDECRDARPYLSTAKIAVLKFEDSVTGLALAGLERRCLSSQP